MNAHNTQTNYMATSHPQTSNHATPSAQSESRINKAYLVSVRGILKLACLVSVLFEEQMETSISIFIRLFFSYSVLLLSSVWLQHQNVVEPMCFLLL